LHWVYGLAPAGDFPDAIERAACSFKPGVMGYSGFLNRASQFGLRWHFGEPGRRCLASGNDIRKKNGRTSYN